jgi:hypothetical protein
MDAKKMQFVLFTDSTEGRHVNMNMKSEKLEKVKEMEHERIPLLTRK